LKIDDKGNFSYKVDVTGFRPEEIKVELQGNKIVIRGERSVPIPAGIDKSTVKCEMENGGHLCINAQSESDANTREIPINFKQTEKKKTQIKAELEIHH
jgi:HSP20 family molecular chaperone IbpA